MNWLRMLRNLGVFAIFLGLAWSGYLWFSGNRQVLAVTTPAIIGICSGGSILCLFIGLAIRKEVLELALQRKMRYQEQHEFAEYLRALQDPIKVVREGRAWMIMKGKSTSEAIDVATIIIDNVNALLPPE